MLQSILATHPLILAISLAVLATAAGLTVRRRLMLQQQRRRRLAEQSADDSGGETSVLPLKHLASSVEVLDLDELLAGEAGSVAEAARRQLEAATDIVTAPETIFPLPLSPRPLAPVAVAAMVSRPAAPRATTQSKPAGAAPGVSLPVLDRAVPVRELALAWFEARGYRPSSASEAVRPIELVLRHRKDPARAYAFIVELERLTSDRAAALLSHARSIGLTRVLVAAETGIDPETRHRFRRHGVRLIDQDEMKREFAKLEISVAAKIIAVARNRARLRKALQP